VYMESFVHETLCTGKLLCTGKFRGCCEEF
jgi:hypothetical protein